MRVRPLFLKSEERINALLFINILALTLYSLVEWLCRKNHLQLTARTVLRALRKVKLIDLYMLDGRKAVKLSNVDEGIKAFFSAVGVSPPIE